MISNSNQLVFMIGGTGNGIPTSGITNDRVIIMYDDEEANYLDARIKKEA